MCNSTVLEWSGLEPGCRTKGRTRNSPVYSICDTLYEVHC